MARAPYKWNPKPEGFVMPEPPDLTIQKNQMEFLNYCMDKGGHAAFFEALKKVVVAVGVKEMTYRTGVGRQAIDVILKKTQKMQLFTWINICRALGLEFNIGNGRQAPYFTVRKDDVK